MARRTTQRRDAVFALYQSDVTGRGLDELLGRSSSEYTRALAHATEDHTDELDDLIGRSSSEYTRALAHATEDHTDELDDLIGRHAEGWTVDRIAPLERAILRTALLEMLHPDIVPADRPIPPEGAISEAVELAKTFAGAQSPGFVNGILAAVLREISETPREP